SEMTPILICVRARLSVPPYDNLVPPPPQSGWARAKIGTIFGRFHWCSGHGDTVVLPTDRLSPGPLSLAVTQFMVGMLDERSLRPRKAKGEESERARRKVLTRPISMPGNVEHSDHSDSRFLRSLPMDRHLRRTHSRGYHGRLRHHEFLDYNQYRSSYLAKPSV